jgi:hypothetical protein
MLFIESKPVPLVKPVNISSASYRASCATCNVHNWSSNKSKAPWDQLSKFISKIWI